MGNRWGKYKFTCAYCKKQIINDQRQKTCSMKCREALKLQRRTEQAPVGICPGCGDEVKLIYKAHEFFVCGYRCKRRVYMRHFYRKRREKNTPSDKVIPAIKECDECGAEFVPRSYRDRFCNKKCSQKASTRRRQAKLKREFLEKQKQIGKCELCETPLEQIKIKADLGILRIANNDRVKLHRDHIIPKSSNGDDSEGNIRYVCWFCNWAKNNLPPEIDSAIAAAGKAFWENINGNTKNMDGRRCGTR